nr:putative reverse transcriptase and intron maturase [Oedogonium sp. HN1801B]
MNNINFINGTRCNTKIKLAKYNRIINNLKRRIFVAKQQGRFRIMRKLQNLLIKAHSNRLIAVKNVYQIPNSNIVFVQEQENFITKLKDIDLNKWKPKVTKLLCYSKFDNNFRLNNIEVLMDRALQIIIKNALEPEWKAISQKDFFQFKKEQCPRDVIQYINYLNNTQSMKKWIIRVKIKSHFDCISKHFLNKVFHSFPAKKIVQLWLKVKNRQNNIINGLLATFIFNEIKNMFSILNTKVMKVNKKNTIVHYNNEFLFSCKTKEDAFRIKEEINSLLNSYGLLINNLQIQHIREGFNFLGFNFCVYTNNNKYGKQELKIEPSKESVFKMKKKLKKIWMKSNGFSISKIIKNFNPLIIRWAHYFKIGKSSKTLKLLDHFMYRRQLRFTKKAHPKKSVKWIEQRYRRFLSLGNKKKLVFGCKETGAYMLKFSWVKN